MAPKRSRKGAERLAALVVAPMIVNCGRSIRMLRAEGHFPMTISSI